MRRTILIGLALIASLMFAATASAATHHKKPLHCKAPKHRNGRRCVVTPKPVQGPVGPAGPAGPVGATGAPGIGLPGSTGAPAPASPYAYDNVTPESRVDNPVSLGYGATQTTQFGSQIALGREGGISDPEVEVLMSVWTCEAGEWNAGCVTTDPSATFEAPLTLNVYAVGSENSVGELLATTTETFDLHYRPTSNCPTDPTKYLPIFGTSCNHGRPTPVTFDVADRHLPHKFIVAVEFDPTGPLASLNVALEGSATVGTNPIEALEEGYADFGASTTFALEGEWGVGEGQIATTITGDQPVNPL